jgi:hypothetical protein
LLVDGWRRLTAISEALAAVEAAFAAFFADEAAAECCETREKEVSL